MRAKLPWIATALMGAGALLLWLNLRERDFYETGSLTPPDATQELAADVDRLLRPTLKHGDSCEHKLEVVSQRRELTLRDVDGWHRLFWAGDDVYHYRELVHLAADLQNSTATEPRGRWEIRVKAAAEPCGTSPLPETPLVYELKVADGEISVADDPRGVPKVFPALIYSCLAAHLPPALAFSWHLTSN